MEEKPIQREIEDVFSRAANIIRESIGVEGVIFLDTNNDHFGSLVDHSLGAKESSSEESTDSKASSIRSSMGSSRSLMCTCLGFASSRESVSIMTL